MLVFVLLTFGIAILKYRMHLLPYQLKSELNITMPFWNQIYQQFIP